ncbi:uncharacterized protein LOC114469592 isoform X2 [Gouania willdenowi]|uniref:uncharacterized protein LOC114469592 isoform X2 n=1 Tax=Gouania willdenowi TaxID=441366 RepID=UPI001056189B|nr:protein prune homolog 2 isoform X2 [Gouania willdenowi]
MDKSVAATQAIMEEYLRRIYSSLAAEESEGPVHAVLGGPKPDVDTVAATLCLALHLNQASGGVCVPVLCCDAVLPEETLRYLQRVKINESLLLWRDDVDLVRLHQDGRLSITLLRDGLLESSEYRSFQSSFLRVVHDDGQRDAEDDDPVSTVTTVATEILQDAAEHIRAELGEILGVALQLQRDALWIKEGRRSAKLEDLISSLDQWRETTDCPPDEEDLMTRLAVELKEFSNGEMTVALTSLTTDMEAWYGFVGGLKSFSHCHGFDGLVILLTINDAVSHPRQQVAVYSNNPDVLDQVCCELEESSSWSLSGELDATGCLKVYHIPMNTTTSFGTPPLLEKEIHDILRDFVDQRTSVLACDPSSRTSSTEGVAGSVEFSQGSSGINDMDGSDIEKAEGGNEEGAIARVMADGEEDSGRAGACAGGELISPDSGMTTIRSSRSSKESSVFLSDDSPVGEIGASGGPAAGSGGMFLKHPSPLGCSSLTPPAPPERRKNRSSRNKLGNVDLLGFDPLQSSDHTIPTGGEMADFDERDKRAGSSTLSELEELSLLDFSVGGLEHRDQIHGCELSDTVVPPTPVNSLVGSRPPSSCGVRFFPEDVVERINGLQHKDSVSSSLSETWDELGFEAQGALSSGDMSSWSRLKFVESPQNVLEEDEEPVCDMVERENREDIVKPENVPQRVKNLQPQLSLITEQTELYDNWKSESLFIDQWNPVSLAELQLTPPEDEETEKYRACIKAAAKGRTTSLSMKKVIHNTLTPDTSKEEEDVAQGHKRNELTEPLDFWTYSAQKGFLKSDSGTTTSYPESLDMWNTTIREDSISPLTTPDNLSENSGSLCGLQPIFKSSTSMESPLGYSEGGMHMWNTTIREDSSSTIASQEGAENGKDHSRTGSMDAKEQLESLVEKQEGEKAEEEDGGLDLHQISDYEAKGNNFNVKIIIETVEGESQEEETGNEGKSNVQGEQLLQNETPSVIEGSSMCDLPVQGMVTSTSEYDNIGAWSLISSPDVHFSSVGELIQLEGESSPFIGLTQPVQLSDNDHNVDNKVEITDKKQLANQVFLFEETSSLGPSSNCVQSSVEAKFDIKTREGSDSDSSPFFIVECSTVPQHSSSSCPENGQIPSGASLESLVSTKPGDTHSVSSIPNLTIGIENTDKPSFKSLEEIEIVENRLAEDISLSPRSGWEGKSANSPDILQAGSQDKHGSSSDADSCSGLEMEYIMVSGTVRDAQTECGRMPKQDNRHSKVQRKSMETFSLLSYAATVLQTQAQTTRQDQPKQNQIRESDSSSMADLETQDQGSLENFTQQHLVPKMILPSQSKPSSESFQQSESRPQVNVEQYDKETSFVTRSASPSLRYSSDHFLKTREEVYVHSQISMEDSDEGGQSPSAPPACPTSFGDFHEFGHQLMREDISQTTSEPESPALTNSSFSHSSSQIETPGSDSAEKGLGLPFSGDLMEEDMDEEEREEESRRSNSQSTSNVETHRIEGQQSGSADLLSFTEDLVRGPSSQTDRQTIWPNTDVFLQNSGTCCSGQPMLTDACDKWSSDQPTGDCEASHQIYSSDLGINQETSQLPTCLTTDNAAHQWTPSQDSTQGQTQYGYNYHHIDQRTENQYSYSTSSHSKTNMEPGVYAEFTTDNPPVRYGAEQTDGYYQAAGPTASCQYVDESRSAHHQYSQYHSDGGDQLESDQVNYQFNRPSFYQSEGQAERDRAQYMTEGYVHFHLSRQSQQEAAAAAAGMMVKMASSEDAAEDLDNREERSSSVDISGGSNQRRKLAAPPMDVSLDHSEGSLLSEDALDTEEDALDTGDDLDVNVDELDTPDEADSVDFDGHGDSEESSMNAAAASGVPVTGHGAAEEGRDSRLWRSVVIGEQEHRIDMKCIEPYKRVISHGGYYAEHNAIIVFAACFLPDSDCDNYNYVMENLFLYVISTLELMVAEDYIIVYLNGATPRRRMPGFSWMKRCYQMIDRRLKKNLKMFIIVHPSWFIRTLVGITRPFISSKFSSKIKYVNSLRELGEIIPMEYIHIPSSIIKYDEERAVQKFACMRLDTELEDVVFK